MTHHPTNVYIGRGDILSVGCHSLKEPCVPTDLFHRQLWNLCRPKQWEKPSPTVMAQSQQERPHSSFRTGLSLTQTPSMIQNSTKGFRTWRNSPGIKTVMNSSCLFSKGSVCRRNMVLVPALGRILSCLLLHYLEGENRPKKDACTDKAED